MKVQIIKGDNLIAFSGKVENLQQLQSIFLSVKTQDKKLGYRFSFL